MGKKAKKTRWRALTLNGHQSDSEESCTLPGNNYQRKYTKFSYSSHSSPIRKFEHESSKTTRSNSTTSDKKATFNEDEYTRITTPRQDVLFKKGYLNKPKIYQTQTSTGTCSTANSTSMCTPDHQSADGMEGTDLEYESQFVFPNGFIDQNGIYYINSFEPFPFVVYNAPICYTEHPSARTKRYSTDSMTESVSPHNEESGITNVSTQPSDEEQSVRLKRRRRRKISPSKSMTSEASSDDVFKTEEDAQDSKSTAKYELKPDAEEFIPRNLHTETVPFDPNIHFFNVQPNFIPVPFINGDLQPPFVPVNFIPPVQNYVNVVPEATPQVQETKPEVPEAKKKTDIDIAKIVWKLEEAAKEQGKKSYTRQQKTRSFQRPRFAHYQNRERQTKTESQKPSGTEPIEKKTEIKVIPSQVRSPRKPNQWIPVANRKKRKNKPIEDTSVEEVTDEPPTLNDDLFESFDINQLVDVVPPSQRSEHENIPEPTSIIEDIAVDTIATVQDITKDDFTIDHIIPEPIVDDIVEPTTTDDMPQPETKKKKKKPAKLAIKKVIVTDFPLVQDTEVIKPENTAHSESKPKAPDLPIIIESKSPEISDKKKKKKKKPIASLKSTSNVNNADTYDFLLENSNLDDFEKRTNVEISQELDRMIQKGIYNNLEEKIKAMNIDLDASFFKIIAKSESRPSSTTTSSRGIFQWNMQEFQDKAFHLSRF